MWRVFVDGTASDNAYGQSKSPKTDFCFTAVAVSWLQY